MQRRSARIALGLLPMISWGLSGCIVVTSDDFAFAPCSSNADCSSGTQCYTIERTDTGSSGQICTRACNADSECPSGGRCLSDGRGGMVCYEGCSADIDCIDGFACEQVEGGAYVCLPAAPPPPPPADPYEGCDASVACVEGTVCTTVTFQNSVGGSGQVTMCVPENCNSDADCPSGGQCIQDGMGNRMCLPDCGSDGSCADGLVCAAALSAANASTTACVPEAATLQPYATCMYGSDPCLQQTSCTQITYQDTTGATGTASMCTRSCTVQEDCPTGGFCANIMGMPQFLCYKQCSSGADCPTGFSCEEIDVMGTSQWVCLPERP